MKKMMNYPTHRPGLPSSAVSAAARPRKQYKTHVQQGNPLPHITSREGPITFRVFTALPRRGFPRGISRTHPHTRTYLSQTTELCIHVRVRYRSVARIRIHDLSLRVRYMQFTDTAVDGKWMVLTNEAAGNSPSKGTF